MTRLFVLLLLCVLAFAQTEQLLEQADAAFREGNTDQAVTLARRVLARAPNTVHAHMIIGLVAAQNNDWTLCNKHFLAVVRLAPREPYGYFYLGQARLYQRQWLEAIRYFTKALQLQYPEKERLLVELALAQQEAGQPEKALATLGGMEAPAEQRLGAQYYAVTAFASAKLGRPGPAVAAIRRSLEQDDTNPETWHFLISTLITTDQAQQALAEAIRAQKLFPDHPGIQFLFALANYYVSESPLSKLALRNLREADPGSPQVLLAEGLLLRKQGSTDEAAAAFRRAAQQGVPDAHLLLGIVYSENGQYPEAEGEYLQAERLNPQNGQVMLELGKVLARRGDLAGARTRLERAVESMPDSAGAHYQLGLVYRGLGETEKSREQMQAAKTLTTKQP